MNYICNTDLSYFILTPVCFLTEDSRREAEETMITKCSPENDQTMKQATVPLLA